MRPTDDERVTGVVRPAGDSPEATLIEPVRPPVPMGIPVDRTERDYKGDEGTVRMEPGAPWAPAQPTDFAAPALQMRASVPEPARPTVPGSPRLPGWVLPYMIGCITLVLVGLFVLWIQARALGHF